MLFTVTIMLLLAVLTIYFLGAIGTTNYKRREIYIYKIIVTLIVIALLYGTKTY